MLLQSKKEHVLHGDMGPDSVFFQYTTPGWMMYSELHPFIEFRLALTSLVTDYLVSGLQTGCTLVLFDGSPLFRPELLWQMSEDLGVTIFGTVSRPRHISLNTLTCPSLAVCQIPRRPLEGLRAQQALQARLSQAGALNWLAVEAGTVRLGLREHQEGPVARQHHWR